MAEPVDKPKRPKFSAPKPPVGNDEVVVNDEDNRPITDTVIESQDETPEERTIPIDTGNSTPKTVSKTTSNSSESSIDSVLSEKSTQKITADPPVAPPPSTKTSPPKEGSRCNAVLVGITAFSLIIGVAGWVLYFSTSSGTNIFGGSTSPTPTLAPTPASVSPTPASNSKTAITLEVLNGSGVSGLAGQTADTLEGMGYTILETGNADNSNYKTTEIYTNPSFTDTTAFLNDLEEEFGSATISGVLKDSTAAARIIVGKDWSE